MDVKSPTNQQAEADAHVQRIEDDFNEFYSRRELAVRMARLAAPDWHHYDWVPGRVRLTLVEDGLVVKEALLKDPTHCLTTAMRAADPEVEIAFRPRGDDQQMCEVIDHKNGQVWHGFAPRNEKALALCRALDQIVSHPDIYRANRQTERMLQRGALEQAPDAKQPPD